MEAGKFTINYNIELKRVNHYTNEVIDVVNIKNLIVNNGLQRIAELLNGVSSTYMRAIAIGTGTTTVTNSDIALETEVARELATLTYESDYIAKFYKRFEFGSGESYAISEIGILDNSVSGGTLLNHALISPAKDVEQGIDLVATITMTVGRA